MAYCAVTLATPQGVNGSVVYVRHVGAKQGLYIVQPDGSGLREINAESWGGDPDWSPDGRSIVATTETIVWGVHVLDADGQSARPVLPSSGDELIDEFELQSDDPSFSPDGTSVVFFRYSPEADLGMWIVGIDGSGLRQLVPPGRFLDFDPNFSPDGRWITFVRQDDRRGRANGEHVRALFIMRADGSGLRQLTPYSWHVARKHDWSPDGTRILLTVGADTGRSEVSANMVTIRPDGTDAQRVTRFTGGLRSAFAGSYSPDGKQIAFRLDSVNVKKPPLGRHFSVAVINADGRSLRKLTTSRALVSSIDWGALPT